MASLWKEKFTFFLIRKPPHKEGIPLDVKLGLSSPEGDVPVYQQKLIKSCLVSVLDLAFPETISLKEECKNFTFPKLSSQNP